jgi:hypothetical protein
MAAPFVPLGQLATRPRIVQRAWLPAFGGLLPNAGCSDSEHPSILWHKCPIRFGAWSGIEPAEVWERRRELVGHKLSGDDLDDRHRAAFRRVTIPPDVEYVIVVGSSLEPTDEELESLRGRTPRTNCARR